MARSVSVERRLLLKVALARTEPELVRRHTCPQRRLSGNSTYANPRLTLAGVARYAARSCMATTDAFPVRLSEVMSLQGHRYLGSIFLRVISCARTMNTHTLA